MASCLRSLSPEVQHDDKPDDNNEAIRDWSQEEKFQLLQALKTCGDEEHKISYFIPTKTEAEVKKAMDYYDGVAMQHPMLKKHSTHVPKPLRKPRDPLTEWAKLLTDNLSPSELRTETATAVRMIADLEKLPPRECVENINFRDVYHQIANALEGKPLTPDVHTTAVLHKCLVETALASKAFITSPAFKSIVHNVDLSDKEINMIPRPTDDQELSILRHLASQRSYNPLQIPEEYLKPANCHVDTKPDNTLF